MTNDIHYPSQDRIARMAGFLYLVFIVTFASSILVQRRPMVSGDAAATARNIMASERLFRIGFMSELIAAVFFLASAWALYLLLKPVGKGLALLFLILNLAGVAVESACIVIHFSVLLLLGDAGYLKPFSLEQTQALAMLLLKVSGNGSVVTALFYGVWLFPLGYLVVKSRFLPRILGILLILDGLSLIVCFFSCAYSLPTRR